MRAETVRGAAAALMGTKAAIHAPRESLLLPLQGTGFHCIYGCFSSKWARLSASMYWHGECLGFVLMHHESRRPVIPAAKQGV